MLEVDWIAGIRMKLDLIRDLIRQIESDLAMMEPQK